MKIKKLNYTFSLESFFNKLHYLFIYIYLVKIKKEIIIIQFMIFLKAIDLKSFILYPFCIVLYPSRFKTGFIWFTYIYIKK